MSKATASGVPQQGLFVKYTQAVDILESDLNVNRPSNVVYDLPKGQLFAQSTYSPVHFLEATNIVSSLSRSMSTA